MRRWQLQEAKARLSEVVRSAQDGDPQEITVRGEAAVVVLSCRDYERLRGPRCSFVEFMASSPLAGVELDLQRDRSLARQVDL